MAFETAYEFYGWHHGFGAAGVGLLIGIVIYLSGGRNLPADDLSTSAREAKVRMQRGDPRKVAVILLLAAPTALALGSRAAPVSVNAMMVGSYYLGLFVGGIVSGWLARFYEPLGPVPFWMLHMAIGVIGALSVIVLRGMFVRGLELGGKEAAAWYLLALKRQESQVWLDPSSPRLHRKQ